MRGRFTFDPAPYDYGAATASLRQLFSEWLAIDWFVPPREHAADTLAKQLIEQHNARARAHQPEVFPAQVETRLARGGWDEFAALCARVKAQSWDWKLTVLKGLSWSHSQARGWSPEKQASRWASVEPDAEPHTGSIFYRFKDSVIWNMPRPALPLKEYVPHGHVGTAEWYLMYANADTHECIEWQLAEDSSDLEGNPFLPLMRCHAAGFYPFSLGPDEILLFSFNE